MIVRFYVDVSGKAPEHQVVTAAGYVASDAQWAAFEPRWKATLDLAQIPFFHATEFWTAKSKPFAHLNGKDEEQKKLAALFALTAYTFLPNGFSFSIDANALAKNWRLRCALSRLKTPHDRVPPAMFAVSAIANQVARKCLPPNSGNQAVMLLEDGDGVGEIVNWLYWLKKIGEPWTGAFTEFKRCTKADLPAQAADHLAHETWREATAVLLNPKRTWADLTRDQFKLMSTGPDMLAPAFGTSKLDVNYATKEHFGQWAPAMRRFIADNAEYQRPRQSPNWKRMQRMALRVVVGFGKRLWYRWLGMRWP